MREGWWEGGGVRIGVDEELVGGCWAGGVNVCVGYVLGNEGRGSLSGQEVRVERCWYNGHGLNVHLFFNIIRATGDYNVDENKE